MPKCSQGLRRVLLGDVIVFLGTLQIFLGAFWLLGNPQLILGTLERFLGMVFMPQKGESFLLTQKSTVPLSLLVIRLCVQMFQGLCDAGGASACSLRSLTLLD